LRFIWIGLFIAVVSQYLSTRPRPEVRSLFSPAPCKNPVSSSSPLYSTMDGSRDYDLCIRQQPKQARMCGVGGMSLPEFFFFSCKLFFFFGLLAVCGKRHGLGSLTFCFACPAADRRPIDPPPIVQLRVIDKARKNLPSPSPSPPPHQQQQPPAHPHAPAPHSHESSAPLDTSMLTPAGFGGGGPFLQNPYYFMFASLAKPDDDTELHWMKVRCVLFFEGPCRRHHCSSYRPCLASPLFTLSLLP
jgi:hypothetical protein